MRGDVMGKLVLRPYTIVELDQMREALRVLCEPVPTMADIEDQLRTHMINGTDPADLIAAAAVRAVDDGIAIHQRDVDRCRHQLVLLLKIRNASTAEIPDLVRQLSRTGMAVERVDEALKELRREIIELERYRAINGR